MFNSLRVDYLNNKFVNSKNFFEIMYKTKYTDKLTVPIGAPDPWPCTYKGFLANTNDVVEPEYAFSSGTYVDPDIGEIYFVDGTTGQRKLVAVYDMDLKRFISLDGLWTQDTIDSLRGD